MKNNKSKLLLTVGVITTFISLVIRLNARQIAWPKRASWGAEIEATPFYAKQLAIADVSNMFLAFGLILIAAVLIRSLFNNVNTAEQ
jgi:hypothetical protein